METRTLIAFILIAVLIVGLGSFLYRVWAQNSESRRRENWRKNRLRERDSNPSG
jgi:Tfp pilus assembly protein PilV